MPNAFEKALPNAVSNHTPGAFRDELALAIIPAPLLVLAEFGTSHNEEYPAMAANYCRSLSTEASRRDSPEAGESACSNSSEKKIRT